MQTSILTAAARDFEAWLGTFRASIADYGYYLDVKKIAAQAERYRNELHLLNALIGQSDIEARFRGLVAQYPSAVRAIPSLLAVRAHEIYAQDGETGGCYRFRGEGNTLDEYCVFMRKTGLFDLISRRLVGNLYDYVLGVEAGLDSNGRKNRGGHLMEDAVESHLRRAGVAYDKEVRARDVQARWGVDLSALTDGGKTDKRFDFAVRGPAGVYAVETNFYAQGGSKLNETARSYEMLALKARSVPGFRFVWVTDGTGWRSARRNLRETFDVLPALYNLKDLEDGAFRTLFA